MIKQLPAFLMVHNFKKIITLSFHYLNVFEQKQV